jgi:hypothetical protein
MWVNTVLPGDFFWSPSGESVRVAAVVDNTHLTLAYNWPGATQSTGPYEIRFQADQGRVQETTRQLLERMQSGNLYAFAGLAGMTDTIPYFTGPGAMGLLTKQDLINGVHFDVQVDTLPDRNAYDNETTGFIVLVSDMGDGRSAVFTKESIATGDWSAPAYITGTRGMTWRGVWSSVTAYVKDDGVSYNGASYIALTGSTNVTPVAGATWGIISTRGATGLTGMNPRGTYSGATAYVATDSVLYNGSTFVALQATTGNAPPTLPTTSNAFWQLVAIKGTDGAGTGDVVGPAGVTDGSAAMFNTTTGKLIKEATPSQFRTWLGQTAATVSFDNTVAKLSGAPTTVQTAIESLATSNSNPLNSILTAKALKQMTPLIEGFADGYGGNDGINPSSTGYSLDAGNSRVVNAGSPAGSLNIFNPGTLPASAGGWNGYTVRQRLAPARITTNGAKFRIRVQGGASGCTFSAVYAGQGSATVGNNFTGDQVQVLFGGSGTITLSANQQVWSDWMTYNVSATTPFVVAFQVSTGGGTLGRLNPTDTDFTFYYKAASAEAASTTVTGYTTSAGDLLVVNGIDVETVSTLQNMNLITTTVANFQNIAVNNLKVTAMIEAIDAVALNTDVTMEVSRDAGTTWTMATLTQTAILGTKSYVETNVVNVTGQPSGDDICLRYKTLNTKRCYLHGVHAKVAA